MSAVITTEGRYELLRELASGGMATVFEARARSAGGVTRMVALKRIHPHLSKDAGFREMFLDEARIVSRIDHPNVCRILDYGDGPDGAFIVMELLSGLTVQAILKAMVAVAPADEAYFRFVTTLVLEAAEGLHAAHEARGDDGQPLDIVHRDVSPSNLLLTDAGELKVLDFGVAKARNRIYTSMTGEVKGKFSYMAPEQTRGQAERRSDVWALGVIHYELLTLRPLFRRGTQPETILAVEREPIPLPQAIRPALEGLPTDVVLWPLQRELSARPPTALAYAERLAEVLRPFGGPMSRRERRAYAADFFPARPVRDSSGGVRIADISVDVTEQSSPKRVETAVTRRDGRRLERPIAELEPQPVATGPRRARWAAAAVFVLLGASALFVALGADGAPRDSEGVAMDAPDRMSGPERGPSDPSAQSEEAPVEDANGERQTAEQAHVPTMASPTTPTLSATERASIDARPVSMRPVRRADNGTPSAPAQTMEPAMQPTMEPTMEDSMQASAAGRGTVVVPRGVAVCLRRRCGPGNPPVAGALMGTRRSTSAGTFTVYQVPYAQSAEPNPPIVGRAEVSLAPGATLDLGAYFSAR